MGTKQSVPVAKLLKQEKNLVIINSSTEVEERKETINIS